MENALLSIVQKLLAEKQIGYDKKELAFQIQSHPSYPSLHAITGVLDHFNIENIAAEVPQDIQTLQQLPNAFIAQVSTERGNNLVAVTKNSTQYIVSDGYQKDKKISENEFLSFFTGVVVAVEKDDNRKPIKNSNKLKNIILLFCLIIAIGYLLIIRNTDVQAFTFTVLSLIGIIISYSILRQELGGSTFIGEKFCSSTNDKKNCDAVLNSKGAEIIKDHKLSDISIIYFSSLLLIGLLANHTNILQVISHIALPITLYSIYYQYKIVKSFCLLCLSIVGVLWLQAITAYLFIDNFNVGTINIIITITSFIVTYLIWSIVKPLAKNVIKLQKEKVVFVKFKRSFTLFNNLLQQSSTINTSIKNIDEIIFGNKNAHLEIIIIINPFCRHCKPVHEVVNKILEKYTHLVKVIIRFNIPLDNPDAKGVIVASKLIELYNQKGAKECKNAMSEIYEGYSFKKWISKWGETNNKNSCLGILNNQREWCTNNAINFTPEVLIQGKSFPKEYNKEDILFFIENLEEYYQPSQLQKEGK